MLRPRFPWGPLAAGLALIACGWLASARSPSAATSGNASGVWQLPEQPMTSGYARGVLVTLAGVPLYRLDGVVDEVVSPCLSCREGTLSGVLVDGSGGPPRLLFAGDWLVSQLSGKGSFDAVIYALVGPALLPVGRIDGSVDDPPSLPDLPGKFSAGWLLRR